MELFSKPGEWFEIVCFTMGNERISTSSFPVPTIDGVCLCKKLQSNKKKLATEKKSRINVRSEV